MICTKLSTHEATNCRHSELHFISSGKLRLMAAFNAAVDFSVINAKGEIK
jgi:hypothetical protein